MNARRPYRARPCVFGWTGEVMVPIPRFKLLCDRQFSVGEEYALEPPRQRTQASHNNYFAQFSESFMNLDERYKDDFKNEDAFRAWCLIQCGFCTETDYTCSTPAEARALAVSLRRAHNYAIVDLKGNVVKHLEPESQSNLSMGQDRFEESKREVLDLAASMANTTAAALKKNAGRSA